jgi:iron complex transport system permease protein
VQRVKHVASLTVAAATGAAVAVSGGIGFIGIVVPHLLRLATGPDHRYLLVNAALLGATLLLLADLIARSIIAPAELPIGIVTAVIGAPVFLWILFRRGPDRRGDRAERVGQDHAVARHFRRCRL